MMWGSTRPSSAGPHTHATRIVLGEPTDETLRVGACFEIAVDVACEHGCELAPPVALSLEGPDGLTRDVELIEGRLAVTAGTTPGKQAWSIRFAESSHGDVTHLAAHRTLSLDVAAHSTSLAVWAIPDVVVAGTRFAFKVGASSTAGLVLGGQTIEIRDADGAVLARSTLGDRPSQGTSALHWAEVEAEAPGQPGIVQLSASLATTGLSLAHDIEPVGFTVSIADVPQHSIEVTVHVPATGVAVAEAVVRVGAFRATTDANGRAVLKVPPGTFTIEVWKHGFDVPDTPIEVTGNSSVTIAAVELPEEDPDARWTA